MAINVRVKGVKHLKKNLTKVMKSDNQYVKKEYDRLRRQIITVLRDIDEARNAQGPSRSVLPLDQVKLEIEEKTREFSHGLDKLIRKEHIDVQIATSLMNDISYCREICWDLVEAGSVLFSAYDLEEETALRSVALGEDDIIEIMEDSNTGAAQ